MTTLLGRTVRLIVRRQPKAAGEQLAIDDLDRCRLHSIITNVEPERMTAAQVEAHHRRRGGIPEDTIRALKNDFGMIHAPVQSFFGNWLYWQAAALAHNVASSGSVAVNNLDRKACHRTAPDRRGDGPDAAVREPPATAMRSPTPRPT